VLIKGKARFERNNLVKVARNGADTGTVKSSAFPVTETTMVFITVHVSCNKSGPSDIFNFLGIRKHSTLRS